VEQVVCEWRTSCRESLRARPAESLVQCKNRAGSFLGDMVGSVRLGAMSTDGGEEQVLLSVGAEHDGAILIGAHCAISPAMEGG